MQNIRPTKSTSLPQQRRLQVLQRHTHNHHQGTTTTTTAPNTARTTTTATKNRSLSTWFIAMCFLSSCLFMVLNVWTGYSKIRQSHSCSDSRHNHHKKPSYEKQEDLSILPELWTSKTSITKTNIASSCDGKHQQRIPTNHACDGYQGIYHIEKGDIGGAAGTIFFQFVIGQLIYAEMYNLKPWVYLNNVSYIIYDPIVHGRHPGVNFTMMSGMNASYIQRPNGHWRDSYPGPPQVMQQEQHQLQTKPTTDGLIPTQYHFHGNGVWEDYFEPVSDFVPGDTSCQQKPLITMDLYLVTPGIHGFAPWAPRCWRYQYLPDYVTKPHIPLQEWLEPQRHVAHKVLTKYINFLPHIKEKAQKVNPFCSLHNNPCLGLHIRQSDKAAGRRQIETDEFLPYVQAFVKSGGQWIYLATDSVNVINHVRKQWPQNLQEKIRTLGDNVVRSNNEEAVFDIGSHHRVNTEILIEILALSKCQFMIHGLSAVTETSIWINIDLHYTAINLEDPDHLDPNAYSTLVRYVLNGGNATQFQLERRQSAEWWKKQTLRTKTILSTKNVSTTTTAKENTLPTQPRLPTDNACKGVDGILHISNVGSQAGAGTAFFSSILNQLLYAEKYNLKPWIHLSNESRVVYDDSVHGGVVGTGVTIPLMDDTAKIEIRFSKSNISASSSVEKNATTTMFFPGEPIINKTENSFSSLNKEPIYVHGDGVWENYFLPVSDFVPGDTSCYNKPLISMKTKLVMPGLLSWSPWSIRAWRYDDVPDNLWNPEGVSLRDWLEPMRREAHRIVKTYYKFQPHIVQRAMEVNPLQHNGTIINSSSRRIHDEAIPDHHPCLAVHIRNTDKAGRYRSKFPPNKFRQYMQAFERAGGQVIYVAADSHRSLEYIDDHFPVRLRNLIRTQGKYVVRSNWKWPIHMLEKHHRTNSEVLVDILAMSKCQLLLHGNSAVSEAAIYLNINLHNQSVNWEDPDRMSVQEFEKLSRTVLARSIQTSTTAKGPSTATDETLTTDTTILKHHDSPGRSIANLTIVRGSDRKCRKNAIVYLAQKRHSSYDRDSYGILLESMELMKKNYLSLNDHHDNTDLIIFHTSDFDMNDLNAFEARFGTEFRDLIQLVDLSNSTYWRRPRWHKDDNPTNWYAYPLFSEGYRRMMHWFAIDIWKFFADYNAQTGCNYEYIMRFDEDSFLHSPIQYDIFDFMRSNDYVYGFRLCSYEMQVTQRIWKMWRKSHKAFHPIRDIQLEMCGFYNNFFVANLTFFQSTEVTKFLKYVDRQGMIYRRRLGDLMIHSMAVYSFAPPEKIHRFLDFTYEHCTIDKTTGCVMWGGIQAGYNDANSDDTLFSFYKNKIVRNDCQANLTIIGEQGLSPTYSHIPKEMKGKVQLKTVMAGKVELSGKGVLSG